VKALDRIPIKGINQYSINIVWSVLINDAESLFNIVTRHSELVIEHNSARVQVHSQLPYYFLVCINNFRRRKTVGKFDTVPKMASNYCVKI
jgi:hypothetical protein